MTKFWLACFIVAASASSSDDDMDVLSPWVRIERDRKMADDITRNIKELFEYPEWRWAGPNVGEPIQESPPVVKERRKSDNRVYIGFMPADSILDRSRKTFHFREIARGAPKETSEPTKFVRGAQIKLDANDETMTDRESPVED